MLFAKKDRNYRFATLTVAMLDAATDMATSLELPQAGVKNAYNLGSLMASSSFNGAISRWNLGKGGFLSIKKFITGPDYFADGFHFY